MVVDATGVGRPVIDQMRAGGLDPVAVTITSGKATKQERGGWKLPKIELLRPLVTAVEGGRLKISAGLPYAEALMLELRAFERRVTRHANEQFEGRGEHDDLVIAAALVCWRGGVRIPL